VGGGRAKSLFVLLLNLRSESGASHEQHGKENASEDVERKTESRPSHRDSGILNEPVVKEVENSVPGESSDNQPKVLFEACHGQREKGTCYQGLQRQRRLEFPMTANKM